MDFLISTLRIFQMLSVLYLISNRLKVLLEANREEKDMLRPSLEDDSEEVSKEAGPPDEEAEIDKPIDEIPESNSEEVSKEAGPPDEEAEIDKPIDEIPE